MHPQSIPVTANIVVCPAPQWKSISYYWMLVPPSIPQIFLEFLSEVLSTSLYPCSEQHKRLHCSYTRSQKQFNTVVKQAMSWITCTSDKRLSNRTASAALLITSDPHQMQSVTSMQSVLCIRTCLAYSRERGITHWWHVNVSEWMFNLFQKI